MERTDERGREATTPTDIPRRGWRDVLARTMASLKADQVPEAREDGDRLHSPATR